MEQLDLRELQMLVRQRRAFEFSNFTAAVVVLSGVEYPTVEHAYQASKTLSRKDREMVQQAHSPGEAKRLGKHLVMRKDWDIIKFSIMDSLLQQKFKSGSKWADQLILSGQQEIVEWNTWHDKIWGKCVCDSCKGEGQNWLGILLILRRSHLVRTTV